MYIKEFKIKNFRAFANEVHLNLKPNTNGIEEDLETNNFKKISDSEYFCSIASIGSANAKGKSSLLNCIVDLCRLFCVMNNPETFNNPKTKDMDLYLSTIGISDKKIKQKIKNIDDEILASLKFNNLSTPINLEHYRDMILNIFTESKLYDEKTALIMTNAYINDTNSAIAMLMKNIINDWKTNKHNVNQSASLCITVYDEENHCDVIITIYDDVKIGDESLRCTIEPSKTINQENFIKAFADYCEAITYMSSTSMFPDLSGHQLWMANAVSQSIIQMYKLVERLYKIKSYDDIIKKIIKIINIADSNIKNISFHNSNNIEAGVLGFIYGEGNLVSANNISMGTLKFITTFNIFANAIINHSQLILIDEIDAYLHISLVEFFKTWIRQANYHVQMIFTSHNYEALTKNLSHKQIFIIDDDEEGTKKIVKVSSVLNNNKSAIKALMEQRIGSHPAQTDIDECVWELIDGGNSINE